MCLTKDNLTSNIIDSSKEFGAAKTSPLFNSSTFILAIFIAVLWPAYAVSTLCPWTCILLIFVFKLLG